MKVDKYSIEGKVIGEAELNDAVFGSEINDNLIYELVKVANANLRQGTHKAKERAEIRATGAKPWRQKGTGRARAGSVSSPIWRGGGVVFGPRVRSYERKLPKKMKKAAYVSLLSLKAKNGAIKVVEDFTVEGKTKEMARIGKSLQVSKGVLVCKNADTGLRRAIRNLSWFSHNDAERLSGRDLFYSKELVITESALKYINDNFAKVK